jgi:hypothetical protein
MKDLAAIQKEIKVPKGNFNSFGKYKYRSCEDILEVAKPVLAKHNATLILTDEIVCISNRIFMKATACLTIGEQSTCVNGFAELAEHKGMSAEQATGSASSYARKYALNGLFLIDETEADPDSQSAAPQPAKAPAKKLISDKQWQALIERVKSGDSAAIPAAEQVFQLNAEQVAALQAATLTDSQKHSYMAEAEDNNEIPF